MQRFWFSLEAKLCRSFVRCNVCTQNLFYLFSREQGEKYFFFQCVVYDSFTNPALFNAKLHSGWPEEAMLMAECIVKLSSIITHFPPIGLCSLMWVETVMCVWERMAAAHADSGVDSTQLQLDMQCKSGSLSTSDRLLALSISLSLSISS